MAIIALLDLNDTGSSAATSDSSSQQNKQTKSASSKNSAKPSSLIPYTVINRDENLDYKISYDIQVDPVSGRLPSEQELAAISRKVHTKKHDRTFVVFYLPGMEVDAGGYATAHHTPDMKVRIMEYNLPERYRKLLGGPSEPEEKFGLSETKRKEVFRYIVKAEEKAEQESGEKYPLDPTQSLEVGDVFQLTETTPMMSEFEPKDPLEALGRSLRLPVGAYIKVFQIDHQRDGGALWYQVRAIDQNKQPLGSGWINSVALRGQAQINSQEQMRRRVTLENELGEKYKARIRARYNLTNDQFSEVMTEGVTKGW